MEIPATFINGSEDIRPSWPTRQLADLIPPGAAHTVWLTHADELRATMREAIARIVAFR